MSSYPIGQRIISINAVWLVERIVNFRNRRKVKKNIREVVSQLMKQPLLIFSLPIYASGILGSTKRFSLSRDSCQPK